MVLLDLDDGECDAVGLEGWDGGGDFAEESMGSEFQLYGERAQL